MRTLLLLAAFLFTTTLAACGEDPPVAPSTTPTTPTTPTGGGDTLMPTLSSIQAMVFTPTCVAHHGAADEQADLNLEDGMSHAGLVNMASGQIPTLNLVAPNDAENSYLIHKLEGRAGIVGDRMPSSAQALTTEQIDVIKGWINDGAQNN